MLYVLLDLVRCSLLQRSLFPRPNCSLLHLHSVDKVYTIRSRYLAKNLIQAINLTTVTARAAVTIGGAVPDRRYPNRRCPDRD